MYKSLRVSAFIMVLLASGIITKSVLMLNNTEPKELFPDPGIIQSADAAVQISGINEKTNWPLVEQARAFALRIDPPVQVSKSELQKPDTVRKPAENEEVIITIPEPLERFPFDLLATVRYVSVPEKSLALFRTGNKQKWFYRGQAVGAHMIEDIHDGRVTLTQPNQKSEEILVPPKSNSPSLIKES